MGFVGEEGTYLNDGWNLIDFFVVASSFAQQLITFLQMGDLGG